MNQNDVLPAVRQGKHKVMATVATETGHGRCSQQHALSVAKIHKCHLNHALTDQSIAATATIESKSTDKARL